MNFGSNSKKVLFITYHFPPDAAVGGLRTAKFVKYLPLWGWEPFVLTVQEKHIALRDAGRLKGVEHVTTARSPVWPSVPQLALNLRDTLKYFGRGGAKGDVSKRTKMILKAKNSQTATSLSSYNKLKRWIDSLFELPDQQIGWLVPAVRKACWLIRKHEINLVVTSSPPRTTALVGLILSYLMNIKLFTDLRDPWYRPIRWGSESDTWLSEKIKGWLEEKIMERSTRVFTTTENYRSFLLSSYGGIRQDKFYTIWNGYDEEDFKPFEKIGPTEKFIISYLGTFYFGRTPKTFLIALGELIREGKVDKSRIEVRFFGDVCYAEGESVESLIQSQGLNSCVKIHGPVPYDASLKAMKQSNLLLLFAPNQPYSIPAKTFEYLGSGRNILCFSQDGATADFIKETGSGTVIATDHIDEVKSSVFRYYLEYEKGLVNEHNDTHRKFQRKSLAFDLSLFLEETLRK